VRAFAAPRDFTKSAIQEASGTDSKDRESELLILILKSFFSVRGINRAVEGLKSDLI